MDTERHVKLFRNVRNQAVRIPRELELDGDDAVLRKERDRLIIEPIKKWRLIQLLDRLEPIEDELEPFDDELPELDDVDL